MVKLSDIVDELGIENSLAQDLAYFIENNFEELITEDELFHFFSNEYEPEVCIEKLISLKIIGDIEIHDTCCNSIIGQIGYCIFCSKSDDVISKKYRKVNGIIKYTAPWRDSLFDELGISLPAEDVEYIRLITSQLKSLDKVPLIPITQREIEKMYQLMGYRILINQYDIEMECLAQDGRSDLKFKKLHERMEFIGEYKIWSNKKTDEVIVDQCLNYFNSDTKSAFIFTVNNLKKNCIWDKYISEHIIASNTYQDKTSLKFISTRDKFGLNIYHSSHFCNVSSRAVCVYHFIYDLYGNFGKRSDK